MEYHKKSGAGTVGPYMHTSADLGGRANVMRVCRVFTEGAPPQERIAWMSLSNASLTRLCALPPGAHADTIVGRLEC